MGSFLGSAAGAVAGGISSIIGGALSNSAARHAATVANQRNIYNYQHRYQWAMDDMQKAGLNPMLAATQGIGSSINGASALSANYNIGEGVTTGSTTFSTLNSSIRKFLVCHNATNRSNRSKILRITIISTVCKRTIKRSIGNATNISSLS